MTSEGLGEVFKGDSADTCARKFPLVSMGERANGQACADGERGPPSVRAEIFVTFCMKMLLKGMAKHVNSNLRDFLIFCYKYLAEIFFC